MSEEKWTPGPWRQGHKWDRGEEIHNPNIIFGPSGEAICEMYGIPLHVRLSDIEGEPRWLEGMANAALVSAAPAMYRALEEIVSEIKAFSRVNGLKWPDMIARADAALKAARGERE